MEKILILVAIAMIGLAVFSSCSKKSNTQTLATATTAILDTATISSITLTTAVCGGNITSNGGAPVTARGVCWNTSGSPTVALTTKTMDGSGSGSYTSSITGLLFGTTYYVCAYATNSVGTVYGLEQIFTTLGIGTYYEGGIIAYILRPSDSGYSQTVSHGLIAAPSDQSMGIQWGCYGTSVGASGYTIGTGKANTAAIVSACGTGTAAYICYTFTLGGYTDWYLPSDNELFQLVDNQTAIGGFASATYWSSSETDNYYAWGYGFSNSGIGVLYDLRNSTHYVRAVRSF